MHIKENVRPVLAIITNTAQREMFTICCITILPYNQGLEKEEMENKKVKQ